MFRFRQLSSAGGTGRPQSSDRYSTRVRASEKSALNSRCSSRLSRRTSTMKATAGRDAAIYEKFWSGPTPMYAPPRSPARSMSDRTVR